MDTAGTAALRATCCASTRKRPSVSARRAQVLIELEAELTLLEQRHRSAVYLKSSSCANSNLIGTRRIRILPNYSRLLNDIKLVAVIDGSTRPVAK